MKTYEIITRVDDQGRVLVVGVPFAAGTEVEVSISPKQRSDEGARRLDEDRRAASRERMRELFRTVKGFRNSPRLSREELYDRRSLR